MSESCRNSAKRKSRGSSSAGKLSTEKRREFVGVNGTAEVKGKSSSARSSKRSATRTQPNSQSEGPEDDASKTSYIKERPSKVYSLDFHGKKLDKIAEIQRYPNCKSVDLSCNQIKKIESLEENVEICELKLYSNEIKAMEGLTSLRKLQNLQLQHNQIEIVGDGLKDLKALRLLNLASNKICDLSAQCFRTNTNLVFLDLSNNKLKNLTCLNAVPYLEELYLAANGLEECPEASCCKKLQEIDLANNELTTLDGIKNLPNLNALNISGNNINSIGSFGTSRSLQRLDVSRNRISKLLLISKNLVNLEVLTIEDNKIISLDEVLHLQQLKNLLELYLHGNPCKKEVDDYRRAAWKQRLSEILPQLEILDGHHIGNSHTKTGERHFMRPMTPSQGLSIKTVNDQINVMNHEQSLYEDMITSRFESMRNLLKSFPIRLDQTDMPKMPGPARQVETSRKEEGLNKPTSTLSTDGERPVSRCNSRARIKEALKFASKNFIDTSQGRSDSIQ